MNIIYYLGNLKCKTKIDNKFETRTFINAMRQAYGNEFILVEVQENA